MRSFLPVASSDFGSNCLHTPTGRMNQNFLPWLHCRRKHFLPEVLEQPAVLLNNLDLAKEAEVNLSCHFSFCNFSDCHHYRMNGWCYLHWKKVLLIHTTRPSVPASSDHYFHTCTTAICTLFKISQNNFQVTIVIASGGTVDHWKRCESYIVFHMMWIHGSVMALTPYGQSETKYKPTR